MAAAEEELGKSGQTAYVIPEGGSNGLGALGYADAMREVRGQGFDLGLGGGPAGFDAVVHACGSGGTAAGIALGARRFEVAPLVHAIAVCDDRSYFRSDDRTHRARGNQLEPRLKHTAEVVVHDAWKGPGYAVPSDEQLRFILDVARKDRA